MIVDAIVIVDVVDTMIVAALVSGNDTVGVSDAVDSNTSRRAQHCTISKKLGDGAGVKPRGRSSRRVDRRRALRVGVEMLSTASIRPTVSFPLTSAATIMVSTTSTITITRMARG